jgi:uncharacterized protein
VVQVNDEEHDPVEVPFRELSADALRGVAEAFVLREGTDYGERSHSLDEKIAHVLAQLERGEATILFDPRSASVGIVRQGELARRTRRPA